MAIFVQSTLQRASKFARSGQLDLAEVEYRTLLSRYPANKRAKAELKKLRQLDIRAKLPSRHDLAEVANLLEQSKPRQAFEAARRLVARFPSHAMAHTLLGACCTAGPEPETAIAHYQRALVLKPEDADTTYNLGNVYRELGLHAQALDAYTIVIQQRPNAPHTYNNIGVSLAALGQHEAAITAYKQAIRLAPDTPNAQQNLGKEYYDSGDYPRAIAHYQTARALTPDCADTALALGNAYFNNQQINQAIETLEAAIALRPVFPVALNNLGVVVRAAGRLAEAQARFEAAVRFQPDYTEAHYNLSTLKNSRPDAAQLDALHALEQSQTLSQLQRLYLLFALANIHKGRRAWSRSFTYLEQGNRLRRQLSPYDITADNALFTTIRAGFDNAVPALQSTAKNRPTPLFILGMPRSGTTLTEQILASHSHVHSAGELNYLSCSIRDSGWNSGPPTSETLSTIRQDYLGQLNGLSSSAAFITDKMPINFRLIGFILSALPEAKIIHTKRDARATCWSIYSHFFSETGNGNGFAYDQVELATYYRMYHSMMAFWHKQFPGQIYDLSYDSLTENQEAETRKLLAYVGLEWQQQCLDFQDTSRTIKTASAAQVRQKMYQGSSEKWRRYADHLGPMIEILKPC